MYRRSYLSCLMQAYLYCRWLKAFKCMSLGPKSFFFNHAGFELGKEIFVGNDLCNTYMIRTFDCCKQNCSFEQSCDKKTVITMIWLPSWVLPLDFGPDTDTRRKKEGIGQHLSLSDLVEIFIEHHVMLDFCFRIAIDECTLAFILLFV